MRFTIAKPADYMSFGNLFYTKSILEADCEQFEQLAEICRKRAEEKFPRSKNNPENNAILKQIEEELHMIDKTDMSTAVLILKEISDLSNEMGYPTTLLGSESGLIILYLLGVSNIHPRQYNYSTIPSNLYLAESSYRHELYFTLAIAEPVREKILRRLDQRFCQVRSTDHVYHKIGLPGSEWYEKIEAAAKKTGIDYHSIDLENPNLLKSVCDDICCNDLKSERNFAYPETIMELARVFAYAVCGSETKGRFDSAKDYVFRDDVFKALNDTPLSSRDIVVLSRNWSRSKEKIKDIELMKQYGVPNEMISVYRELENQLSAASCLARMNDLLMEKYYENRLDNRSKSTS